MVFFCGGGGGVEDEHVQILCCDPQKALPCVSTHLLVYRMSKSVQRPVLGPWEDFAYKEIKN